MGIWKKVVLSILLAVLGTAALSAVYELIQMRSKIVVMDTAVAISHSAAVSTAQDVDFSDAYGFIASGVMAPKFDIRGNTRNESNYYAYLSSLESQAVSSGLGSSDIREILQFLRSSANEYVGGASSYVYTPLQFDMTFLEEESLAEIFEWYLKRIVKANYGQDHAASGMQARFDMLEVDRVKVNLTGPVLVNLRTDGSEGALQLYASIFGSTRMEALSMLGTMDSMFDFVVAYDVEYVVEWSHITSTPQFDLTRYGGNGYGAYANAEGYYRFPVTTSYRARYVLTN